MLSAIISFFTTLVWGFIPIEISDVYYQWKCFISYMFLRIFKRIQKSRLGFYDLSVENEPEKVGFMTHPEEIRLESPQPQSHLARADDKVFIYGINSKTECFLVSVARLQDGKSEANVYIRLSNGKTFWLENHVDFQQSTGEKNAFSCGGLQMYYLCPMRRWRIFYSGYLKETSEEAPDTHKMTYVKFSLMWRAASDVYDSTVDMDEKSIIKSVAKVEWKTFVPPIKMLHNLLDFYSQGGVIMGNVYIGDQLEEHELYLFGHRMRLLGDMSLTEGTEFSLMMGFVHKNGIYLQFGDMSSANIAKNVIYGFVVRPTTEINSMQAIDIKRKKGTYDGKKLEEIKGSIIAGRSYAFCGSLQQPVSQISNAEKCISIHEMQFYLNGRKGRGIYINGKFLGSSSRAVSDITPPLSIPELLFPMVVTFSESLCQLPEITGGKGSSLGKLTQLSAQLKTFAVPSGVVVTTSSYEEFINKDTLEEIRNLENALYGNTKADAKEVCKRVHSRIITSKIPNNIRDNIVKNLRKIFGEKYSLKKFAVRSSATGEDTEQMSAAGQMDTFLGVSGLSNILLAVKKCWASQFGFNAIQYKRRYGQILNTPMAVVIQEMVFCDVAGVIFTCDPVNGVPTKMSIAANFGLGESVVSGSEEPDTIELARDYRDELSIHHVTIGAKSRKIIVTDEGTSLDEVPESERQECCLSTEKALELGKLAIAIEKEYKSRRDIEWGIKDNNINIFQSRPVTSGTQETDFEIEHEFDGPLRVENDPFSVSNSAEVLPGAITPLSLDVFFRMWSITWQKDRVVEWQNGITTRYFPIGWMTMRSHAMFNVADIFRRGEKGKHDTMEKATMVSFFGRVLEDEEEIFEIAAERFGEATQDMSILGITKLIKCLLFSKWRLKKWQKYYAKYRIPVEKYKTSKDLFSALTRRCCDIGEAGLTLMVSSQGSTIWNMMILTTLSQAKNEMDNEVFADFAKLVTNKGDVESADVPAAIQSLAFHITKSIDPEKFKAMKQEDALNWLKTTSSVAGRKFQEFIDKHGHRCLKEFDLHSVPWGDDPKGIVKLLQNLAGNVLHDSDDMGNTNILKQISNIKVPTGYLSKLKLLFLVPLSRKAVCERESSKSLFIKVMDAWRKGYTALAKLMVSEGRIPNQDIFFFMTLDDIKELLETRSPRVLAKAYHRQRLHSKMDKYIFPEIMKGIPKPINEIATDEKPEEGLFSMKGIPVSQGVAKGYVRVAITLDDAVNLKPGEIMLAYSTDIGWTPYFPTLAGVATELGGLISHGAVVSREYGLPCVAGLHGATRRFQTGDYVFLDGNKGILQKIQPPTEQ